ncbi:MAG: hypothetical protein IKV25_00450 [Clostridia bacterium]|nr:hypothetical protein [Clostridia bacterium]
MKYLRLAVIVLFLISLGGVIYTMHTLSKRDVTPPVITADNDEIHISVKDGREALFDGLYAVDDRDGDITDQIIVERISRFSEIGVSQVSYVVFDKENNLGRYQRTLYYDDYVAPRLQFDKPMLYYTAENISAFSGVRLFDCIDGDISHKLKLEASNVSASVPGIYEVEISAVTNYGDEIHVRLPLNIIDYSADAPVIKLSQYLVYTKKGQSVDPLTYISSVTDSKGAELNTTDIKVSSQVDFNKEGAGQMMLEITNSDGVTGVTYLTVIVEA